ncbi:hypothetical protein TNCV_4603331 [Trichonephila clavipes]|nr:hypothetical protein TNCV_4603331 [Trichonephila clavipes]
MGFPFLTKGFASKCRFADDVLHTIIPERKPVEEEGYSKDDVDETEVNWKSQPRKSLAPKRESTAPKPARNVLQPWFVQMLVGYTLCHCLRLANLRSLASMRQSECCPTQLPLLKRIRDLAAKK